ncbi:MAG: sulfotransferase [Candidatus Bipolaricaulia bacterium]
MELPNLFHIGTQRAGSSYLYNLLKTHPEVSLSSYQEIHFYTRNFHRGVEWYTNSFTKLGQRIDTSPKYFMQGEQAAPRIKELLREPPPLFLLILRNPIDYVHSHYQMQLRKGYFAKHSAMYPKVPTDLVEFVKMYPNYLERGLYCKLLEEHWLSRFDESQFKIVVFEEFVTNTDEVIREILGFFGLPDRRLSTVSSSKNRMLRYPFLYGAKRAAVKRPRLKSFLKSSRLFNSIYDHYLSARPLGLSKDDRGWLREYFSEDVNRLKQRLGGGIPKWSDFR